MPAIFPLQPAFTGGEVSPRLRGRVDAKLYATALAECLNFDPKPQGSIVSRGGTERVGPFQGEVVRGFRTSDGRDLGIALAHKYLRLYDLATGLLVSGLEPVSEFVQNGDFDGGAAGWTSTQVSFTNVPGKAQMLALPASEARVFQKVTLTTGGLATFRFKVANIDRDGTVSFTARIGSSEGATDILLVESNLTADIDYANAAVNFPAAGDYFVDFRCGVTTSAPGDHLRLELDDVSLEAPRADMGADYVRAPWALDEVKDVCVTPEPGKDRVIFTHPRVAPWFLTYRSASRLDFGFIQFAGKPAEWDGLRWPAVCEIYQGRTVWAGVPGEGNRVWGSRVGKPFDLGLDDGEGETPTQASGFDLELSTKGQIRWLLAGRSLLAGTDIGELSFGSSDGVLSVESGINVREESAFGSAAKPAVFAGTHALYLSRDRKKVRALQFDRNTDGWNSKDLTFLAEHVTRARVKEAVFGDGVLYALLDDYTLVRCAFDASEGVIAWCRYDFFFGSLRSLALTDDYLYLVVERGVGGRNFERIALDDLEARHLDSHTAGTLAAGQTEVAGLSWLDGQVVTVLVSGAIDRREALVVDGAVALSSPALGGEEYVVGIPYRCRARTLPVEGANPAGTSQGMVTHFTDITTRLNDSARPLVNGKRVGPGRPFATPADRVEERVTGDYSVKNLGIERGAEIVIEQDLPFRTEVCAVFGKAQFNKV